MAGVAEEIMIKNALTSDDIAWLSHTKQIYVLLKQ